MKKPLNLFENRSVAKSRDLICGDDALPIAQALGQYHARWPARTRIAGTACKIALDQPN